MTLRVSRYLAACVYLAAICNAVAVAAMLW